MIFSHKVEKIRILTTFNQIKSFTYIFLIHLKLKNTISLINYIRSQDFKMIKAYGNKYSLIFYILINALRISVFILLIQNFNLD